MSDERPGQELTEDPDTAEPRPHHHRHRYREFRARFKSRRSTDLAYRTIVTLLGAVVLVGGMLMIPYPGPGWLVVFAGLAILATEYTWAERVLGYAKGRYDAWNEWLKRQHPVVKLAVLGLTGLIVLVTLWLLNAFGLVAGWFGIHWGWLRSPLGVFG